MTQKDFRMFFLTADEFPPFRVDITELFNEQLCGRGHQIDWVMQHSEESDVRQEISGQNGSVFLAKTDLGNSLVSRIRKHCFSIGNEFRSLLSIEADRYDFIQVKDKFIAACLAAHVARRTKSKFVFWLSYPFPEASLYEAKIGTARYPILYQIRGAFFAYVLYRIIAKRASHIFVQSEQMKKDLLAKGIDGNKMTPVPMGVAEKLLSYKQEHEPKKFHTTRPSIVYLGTLLSTRRMDFLVRVHAQILRKVPDAILYFVGPEELPGDRDVIEREARSLDISDSIVLTGGLSREEALSYVMAADVCVSPFFPTPILNSTSPTKLVEYMALSKPVVANDHPEQSLLIEESGGGICVPYEETEFAEAICYLLQTPAIAEQMGAMGRRYVRTNRTYTRIADVVEATYRDLLQDQL